MLYYSFWALAIGSIMYAWRCPKEIAKFVDQFEFAEKTSGDASPLYVPKMQTELRHYYYANSSNGHSWPPLETASENTGKLGGLNPQEAEDALRRIDRTIDNFRGNDLYFKYYRMLQDRYLVTRFIITYLYAGGDDCNCLDCGQSFCTSDNSTYRTPNTRVTMPFWPIAVFLRSSPALREHVKSKLQQYQEQLKAT